MTRSAGTIPPRGGCSTSVASPVLFMPFQRYRHADAGLQRQTVRDWLERTALG